MVIKYYPLVYSILYSSLKYAYRSPHHSFFSLVNYMHTINHFSKYVYGTHRNMYLYVFHYKRIVEEPI